MSSVNWKKLHGNRELLAMINHAARYDGKDVTYRNGYIDPKKTDKNYSITPRFFQYDPKGSSDYRRMVERINEIDEAEPPKRRRKDRVTAIHFLITVPEGFSESEEHEFFRIAYKKICDKCGGPQNVCSYCHFDEIHEFIDCVTKEKKTSRAHMHVIGLPYVPGKGINGAAFATKQQIISLNNEIDQICKKRFGKPFMTGLKGQPRGRKVEDMQIESLKAERKILEETSAELSKTKKELTSMQEKKHAVEDSLKKEEENLQKLRSQCREEKSKFDVLSEKFHRLLDICTKLGLLVATHLEKAQEHSHSIER